VGARADGTKELLAMEIGYRESKASWGEVLRDLRDRGLKAPLLWIADGNLGIWAALSEVFPTARRQRCWNHRLLNLKDKLPKRLHKEVSPKLYELYQRRHASAARASVTTLPTGFAASARRLPLTRSTATGMTS
jgi:putative transposase